MALTACTTLSVEKRSEKAVSATSDADYSFLLTLHVLWPLGASSEEEDEE